jgi:hypothetical protein
VTINDKHIEIIVRQMLRKVRIDQPGDTEQLPFELIDRFEFEEINNRSSPRAASRRRPRPSCWASPRRRSTPRRFLAAASFQETTRVLTEAAINGAKDRLLGLKENVIIGKLIPAGTGAPQNLAAARAAARRAAAEALAGGELPADFGEEEINIFLAEQAAAAAAATRSSPTPPAAVPPATAAAPAKATRARSRAAAATEERGPGVASPRVVHRRGGSRANCLARLARRQPRAAACSGRRPSARQDGPAPPLRPRPVALRARRLCYTPQSRPVSR